MLSSSDFRCIYNYSVLPKGKTLFFVEKIQENSEETDEISREWIRIEIITYSLAKIGKRFLKKRSSIILPVD